MNERSRHARRAPADRPLVLVVDDGKLHVTLLRLALMQRGYAVIVVSSSDGATTMRRERPIDATIVMSELTLPIDFAELDASLRERLKSRVSGTRARVRARSKPAKP